MLKDRVSVTSLGFTVRSAEEEDVQAYYGKITLADAAGKNIEYKKARYFSPMSPDENKLKEPGCYEIIEKKDGEITDRCTIYFSQGDTRPALTIHTEQDSKFGKGAYRITIEWDEYNPEAIDGSYLWLEDQNGIKYQFLTDQFVPQEKKGKWVDEYIYTIPEDEPGLSITVHAGELVQQKYEVKYEY